LGTNVAAKGLRLAIVGPTAVGKSAVALRLAQLCRQRLPGRPQLIICDSVQVVCGFDIGSAKPSTAQRAELPHHLIDSTTWDRPFDAHTYAKQARALLDGFAAAGDIGLVCGGTGLYLRALRYGLLPLPPSDPALRAQLQQDFQAEPEQVRARLLACDPLAAAAPATKNPAHLLRALEICLQTGQQVSALRAQHAAQISPYRLPVVALTLPDATLRQRIAQRTEAMLKAGLLNEVETLLQQGVPMRCQPMRAVGYRACVEKLRGGCDKPLEEAINQATWQYVRRQRTWLRREKNIIYVDATDVEQASQQLLTLLTQDSAVLGVQS
jgi:tRNA dimethylallyltransferase